jgi:hypothetical protein
MNEVQNNTHSSTIIPALLDMRLIRQHYFPLATRTLSRWISAGLFPKADIAEGRKVRLWKRETIENYIDQKALSN